jgi:hypothetical protein
MPAFVPPQVDHNLYKPILPQDNVMQVFSLLDQKQQMYNQGVKEAQYKISSMLNLENEVTSSPVKGMVTDFNKKANDLIKQNSNLDFSIQSNVNLIDGIYDPLLNNKTFLQDYQATKNWRSEVNKALSYRDDKDKDVRDMFNETNLMALNIKRQNLAEAKTEKDIKNYSADLANSSYTPYTDVKKTIREYMATNKDFFKVEKDYATNGYIITTKNGPQSYPSYKTFLESFLSDKEMNQLALEQKVGFYGAYKRSGMSKEEFISSNLNNTIDMFEGALNEKSQELQTRLQELDTYPDDSKLNAKQKNEVAALRNEAAKLQQEVKYRSDSVESLNDYMKKASEGQIDLTNFYETAENMFVKNGVDMEVRNMAMGLSGFESVSIKKDEAYWTNIQENRLSRALSHEIAQDNIANQIAFAELDLKKQKNLIDAAAAGLAVDQYGNVIPGQGLPGAGEYYTPVTDTADPNENVPTEIGDYNTQIGKLDATQVITTNNSKFAVLSAYSDIKGKGALNVEEINTLNKLVKNSKIRLTKENFGPALHQKLLDLKFVDGEVFSYSLAAVVKGAEEYLKNHGKDQAAPKEKAGYNNLKSALDNHTISSLSYKIEKDNLVSSLKGSLKKFEEKYPEMKGLVTVDPNTGLINTKTISTKSNPNMVSMYDLNEGVNITTDETTTPDRTKIAGMKTSDPKETFEKFLKTQEGALSYTGNYMKKVTASEQGSFNWLKQNAETLNNPATYTMTSEELKNSTRDSDAYFWNSNELETRNNLASKFFTSIPDTRFRLQNKNLVSYTTKVEEDKFKSVVYPNRNYLTFLAGFTDEEGKLLPGKEFDQKTLKIIDNIAANGFIIKKSMASNSNGSGTLQNYLNQGKKIPFTRTTAGSTANFTLIKSNTENAYVLEGSLEDKEDFFLDPFKSYTFENGKLLPTSSADYTRQIMPSQVTDISIIDPVYQAMDSQLDFNNKKNSPIFVNALTKFLKNNPSISPDDIPGNVIQDIFKTL